MCVRGEGGESKAPPNPFLINRERKSRDYMHGFPQGSPKSHFLECVLMGSSRSPRPAGWCRGGRRFFGSGKSLMRRWEFLFTFERQRMSDLPDPFGPAYITVTKTSSSEGTRGRRMRRGDTEGLGSRPGTVLMEEVGPLGGGGGSQM